MSPEKEPASKAQEPANAETAVPATTPRKSKKNKGTEALPINKKFAEQYEHSKRREILSKVPAAVLEQSSDSESSSDEEEDEYAEQLTKGIDRRMVETLEAIKRKDPRIYDRKKNFFEDVIPDSSDESADQDNSDHEPVAGWDTIEKAARAETPKMTLKDYVRETLLTDGRLSDSEDDAPDAADPNYYKSNKSDQQHDENVASGGAGAKVEKHKKAKAAQANLGDDSNNEGDESGDDDFFQKKKKTAAELEAEEEDYELFLKKQQAKKSQRAGEDLLLHSYLEKEKPDEKERFLRDFVLNNGWLDRNAGAAPEAGDYAIEVDVPDASLRAEEDEEDAVHEAHEAHEDFNDKVDEFEAKYNFRFEEPGSDQVFSFGRHVPDSMRRPDDRRKKIREARNERKKQEKLVKTEEIKQLKNLKKKEIQARLLAIRDAAGDGIDLSGIDLDAEFDPDKFNKEMENKFGDAYYAQKDVEMKQLSKEDIVDATERRLTAKGGADVDGEIQEQVNRMMDEYYNLDYEDIIGGEPMRFNYKDVEPESFNLSAADILSMEDKELNQLVSLKYLAPYRGVHQVKKRAYQVQRILQQKEMAKPAEEEEAADDVEQETAPADSSLSKIKKRKRNSKVKVDSDQNESDANGGEENGGVTETPNGSEATPKSGKKRRRAKLASERIKGLSTSRKEAYSIE